MNLFQVIFEIFVTIIISLLFFKSEKPKIRYFLFGVMSYFIILCIQIPFRYFEVQFQDFFAFGLTSQIIAAPFIIITTEVGKYISMKKFLKTKSFKNGIFFGMGWITVESINFFTIMFFSTVLSLFAITFDYSFLLNPEYSTMNFLFFFITNLGISIFVVKSIVSNKKRFLYFAIILSLIAYFGLLLLTGFEKYIFSVVTLFISTVIIFNYRLLK